MVSHVLLDAAVEEKMRVWWAYAEMVTHVDVVLLHGLEYDVVWSGRGNGCPFQSTRIAGPWKNAVSYGFGRDEECTSGCGVVCQSA